MGKTQLAIAVVVTVVWAAVWLVAIFTRDYTGATALTPIMLALVTFLFSKEAVRSFFERRNGKDDDDKR